MIAIFLTALVSNIVLCPGSPKCPRSVFALSYKLCATDKYSDGSRQTSCDWDKTQGLWVYDTRALCDREGKRELSVNYGDWRTIDHERLWAVEYRCSDVLVLTPKDVP